jgi:hypothetical protein
MNKTKGFFVESRAYLNINFNGEDAVFEGHAVWRVTKLFPSSLTMQQMEEDQL